MRQIKFRGKDADGLWKYGSLIQNKRENEKGEFTVSFIVPDLPCAEEAHDLWTARMYRVKPETVCQFTGMLDAEGREIYEGDLFRIGEHVIKVVYEKIGRENGFALRIAKSPTLNRSHWRLPLDETFCYDYELIGNIYDNPELL